MHLGVLRVLSDVIPVVVTLAVLVGVRIRVLMVILHQAEIDRHLAHCAGHRQSSVMPPCNKQRATNNKHRAANTRAAKPCSRTPCNEHHGSPGSRRVLRVGHYLTKARRLPSNAVPTRTCVAPSAMAASRSPVMPAEIIIAPGWSALTACATSASLRNAGRGGSPSGATAITPPSSSPSCAATSS